MPFTISEKPLEEALLTKSHTPGVKSQRIAAFDELAMDLLSRIEKDPTKAPTVEFGPAIEEDEVFKGMTPQQFTNSVRTAIVRQGRPFEDDRGKKHSGNALAADVLVRSSRTEPKLVVWKMRPEDRVIHDRRAEHARQMFTQRQAPKARGRAASAPSTPPARGRRSRAA